VGYIACNTKQGTNRLCSFIEVRRGLKQKETSQWQHPIHTLEKKKKSNVPGIKSTQHQLFYICFQKNKKNPRIEACPNGEKVIYQRQESVNLSEHKVMTIAK
jgi:hypothetical protein